MASDSATAHPEPAILALFAAGQMRESEMARLEVHILDCRVCLGLLDGLPEDPMVRMIRDCRIPLSGVARESCSEGSSEQETDLLGEETSRLLDWAARIRTPRDRSGRIQRSRSDIHRAESDRASPLPHEIHDRSRRDGIRFPRRGSVERAVRSS